jgi:hypothetical protein
MGNTGNTGSNTGASSKGYQALSSNDMQAVLAQMQTDMTNSSNKKLTPISSLYSLVSATVSVTTGTGRNQKTVSWQSPLGDPSQQRILLPQLLDLCTTSKNSDLPARINVNTAGQTVLTTLVQSNTSTAQTASSGNTQGTTGTQGSTGGNTTGGGNTQGLQQSDIATIVSMQPVYSSDATVDPIYNTPAWLITEAGLTPQKVQSIERFITARSFVYRFQVVGYYETGGPATRLEAVVDTSLGRPRIVYLRDISELGKGFDVTQQQP